jgi:hypothetical protein
LNTQHLKRILFRLLVILAMAFSITWNTPGVSARIADGPAFSKPVEQQEAPEFESAYVSAGYSQDELAAPASVEDSAPQVLKEEFTISASVPENRHTSIELDAFVKPKSMETNLLDEVGEAVTVAEMDSLAPDTAQVAGASSIARPASPFVGNWQAIDVDGSDMTLTIAGPPAGPFQITWTDNYIRYCDGEAGLLHGAGVLNEADPYLLEADFHLECFTTGATLDFHLTLRYHPTVDTLSVRYEFGMVTIWSRPGLQPVFPAPLGLRVNYGHDWVESFYETGHTVWVTVTESDGVTVKAVAELVTEPKDFWGGETGFQTHPEDWYSDPVDIQPYDWVYGWVDNGASAVVQIGDIQGEIDLVADSISGTISAPWFDDEVGVECHPWGAPEPEEMKYDSALPDGSDEYSCSWTGEWNILPYQDVGVGYFGPDGHWVANAFFAVTPQIIASEAGDWFWTVGFLPGRLDLFIYDSDAAGASLLWKVNRKRISGDLQVSGMRIHGIDLQPGYYLVVSDGENTKGLVLESIAVTIFDTKNEIMAGIAPAGSEVWAAAGPMEWQERLLVHADPESGVWLADFASIGFDITEDMRPWSFAHIYDEDGDANEGSTPPSPTFTVFPEWEWFDGLNWPDGVIVNITVAGKEACDTTASNFDPGFFNGGFPDGCDIIVGDLVTFDDGTTRREHTVQNLAVTDIDVSEDTVSGVADPYAAVYVWPHATGETVLVNADESGNWQVNFTNVFDLVPDECGRSEIRDGAGNSTAVDWCAPQLPRILSAGNFVVEWSLTNPEEVNYLSWKGSANLASSCTPPDCPDDFEFFGNSWVSENENTSEFFFASLVGGGTTGDWSQTGAQVDIDSVCEGCWNSADTPVHTTYLFFDGVAKADLIQITRTFEFGENSFDHTIRPFIPRLYPSDGFIQVIHPDATGAALITEGTCDFGCVAESWDGSWFAVHNPATGSGMIVLRQLSSYSAAVWLDDDDASFTNSSSYLLLQPEGGFTGSVTEIEYLCFYDSSTWTPSLDLPLGCQP